MTLVLFLPFPPSVNTYWRHILLPKKGRKPTAADVRAILSEKGREYRAQVVKMLQEQLPGHAMLSVKVQVRMYFCAPDNRARDLDNYLKAPLDALTHARVWVDDSQVKRITKEWAGLSDQYEGIEPMPYELSPGMMALEIHILQPKQAK